MFNLAGRGNSIKSTARELELEESTIKAYIVRIKEKLGLSGDREDFLRAAIEARERRAREVGAR